MNVAAAAGGGGIQVCANAADAVPLCATHGLYLKPTARLTVSVRLPRAALRPGEAVSTAHVAERVREVARSHVANLGTLRVANSALDVVRLEVEATDRAALRRLVTALDGGSLSLHGVRRPLTMRAAEAKQDFPTRHAWDTFFRDAKNMNEMRPGERPDTVRCL